MWENDIFRIASKEASGDIDEARVLSSLQLLMIALHHLPPQIGQGEEFIAGMQEYRQLMKSFKLDEASKVMVEPREDLDAHAVIDLSKEDTPSNLAKKLIALTSDAPPLSSITISKPI